MVIHLEREFGEKQAMVLQRYRNGLFIKVLGSSSQATCLKESSAAVRITGLYLLKQRTAISTLLVSCPRLGSVSAGIIALEHMLTS